VTLLGIKTDRKLFVQNALSPIVFRFFDKVT